MHHAGAHNTTHDAVVIIIIIRIGCLDNVNYYSKWRGVGGDRGASLFRMLVHRPPTTVYYSLSTLPLALFRDRQIRRRKPSHSYPRVDFHLQSLGLNTSKLPKISLECKRENNNNSKQASDLTRRPEPAGGDMIMTTYHLPRHTMFVMFLTC